EVEAVRALLVEEVERYRSHTQAREVAPLITSFRDHAEDVRSTELERFQARLADLDDAQREAVDALTRGIVAKLLHGPTVGLKGAVGTPRGERMAEALRDLFEL